MSHSASKTFGTLRQNLYQDDYLIRKKGLNMLCNKKNNISSYNQLNTYNWGKYTQSLNTYPIIPINKSNLIIGQYTQLDLNDVCTIKASNSQTCLNGLITYNGPTPFYFEYTIDPNGSLFGNTDCGKLNYTKYMKFTPTNNFTLYNKII